MQNESVAKHWIEHLFAKEDHATGALSLVTADETFHAPDGRRQTSETRQGF